MPDVLYAFPLTSEKGNKMTGGMFECRHTLKFMSFPIIT